MLKSLPARLRKGVAAAALLFPALLLPGSPASATPYTDIVVFGDSLVDAGNISLLSPGIAPASLGYYKGRLSNGPLYTDRLYQASYGSEMTPSLLGGSNFAFGFARAIDNSGFSTGADPIPDLGAQIDMFAARTGGSADPNALYLINIMGNDVVALMQNDIDGMTPDAYAAAVAASMAEQIQRLNDMGARHILATGVPNANIPEAFLLQQYLDDALAGLELENELMLYSFLDLFTRILTNPTSVGLPADFDSTTPCLVGETPAPDIDCTGYFFFDQTHPTTAIHAVIAREIAQLAGITQVSEPTAVALLGFGLVAMALARRRRSSSL